MSSPQTRSKTVQARVAIINGNFPISQQVKDAMQAVRVALSEAADKIATTVYSVPHDEGRLIASLDLIQSAKDVACVSMILPACPTSAPSESNCQIQQVTAPSEVKQQ